jgi:hypothetical protein
LTGPGAPLPSKRKIVGRGFGRGEKLGNRSAKNSLGGNAFLPEEDPEAKCQERWAKEAISYHRLEIEERDD